MIHTNNLDDILLKKYYKIIYFLHIPKTSGKALSSPNIEKLGHKFNIEGVFRRPAILNGHNGYLSGCYRKYKFKIDNNIKITIIRNPFDLLCSYYFHGPEFKNDINYVDSGWAGVNFTHKFKSFDEFINAYVDDNFIWHVPLLKQFLFSQLFDENDKCVPDIIIKYEYLDEAIKILNKYNINITSSKDLNKSNRKKFNYKHYYNDDLKNKIYKKCSRELQEFKYDFNGSLDNNPFIIFPNLKYNIQNNKLYYLEKKIIHKYNEF